MSMNNLQHTIQNMNANMNNNNLNVSTMHPLIQNSQEYMVYKQFVSIHSEDRNISKYPFSNQFEIMLPQDYTNVVSVGLDSWTFPAHYNTFSAIQNNISIVIKFTNIYNPGIGAPPVLTAIYDALLANQDNPYIVVIGEGFYNPIQIAKEITNRMNITVSVYIHEYLVNNGYLSSVITQFDLIGGYDQFVVAYNEVEQKLFFGNKSSGFTLENSSEFYPLSQHSVFRECNNSAVLPEDINWGLPYFLGFSRCPVTAIESPSYLYPRFYYGDYITGDNGYWLLPSPSYGNTQVFYTTSPYKVNLMGPSFFYMEIEGMNNIDETSPYNVSKFTNETNENQGIVKSSFAKISIPTTPISQWFDSVGVRNLKVYNPPAERIRKLQIKLRYHNGRLVDFGTFDYSFTLVFTTLVPQTNKALKAFNPFGIPLL